MIMIVNEDLSKISHSLKNRIQLKRGYFGNGEDASVRGLDMRVVFIDTDVFHFFGDCFLLLINFHLPATTTTTITSVINVAAV